MDAFEQKVRERAYEIWMAAGMCEGRELEHWFAAERDVTPTDAPAAKALRAKKASAKAASKGATKAASSKTVAAKGPAKAASRKAAQPATATLN